MTIEATTKRHLWRYLVVLLSFAVLILTFAPLAIPQTVAADGENLYFGVAQMADDGTGAAVYKLTGISVNAESIAAVNILYPAALALNYSASTTMSWDVSVSPGGGSTTFMVKDGNVSETAASVKQLLQDLTFTLPKGKRLAAGANIRISVDSNMIAAYFENDTIHYYEFVSTDGRAKTWLEAYNLAKTNTYQGLKGYLATITSANEQQYIFNAIAKKPGWLGGTRLTSGGAKIGTSHDAEGLSLDIKDYETGSQKASLWYWACGPEAGQVFYSQAVYDVENPEMGNVANTYQYFANLSNGAPESLEPNNTNGTETCLQFAVSGADKWNDLECGNVEKVYNEGYYVEYSEPYPGSQGSDLDNVFTALFPNKNVSGSDKLPVDSVSENIRGITTTPDPEKAAISTKVSKDVFAATVTTMTALRKSGDAQGSSPLNSENDNAVTGADGRSYADNETNIDMASPVVNIGGNGIPLSSRTGAPMWSLLNLLFVGGCLSLFATACVFGKWDKVLILSGVAAITAAGLCLFTQDIGAGSVLLDRWTIVFAIIFEAGIMLNVLTKRGKSAKPLF